MSDDRLALFPHTAAVDARGRLSLGGCDAVALARRWGTPLYVYDEQTIREQLRTHQRTLASHYADSQVLYAGKAYLGLRLAQIVAAEGAGLDCVSAGELFVAQQAGFPLDRVCLHGNNKSLAELEMALDLHVGRIAVDNLHELSQLSALAGGRRERASILLRLAPAVDPHTHRFIATGAADSKFGLPIAGNIAGNAVARALADPALSLSGYHTHVGSQIHDLDVYAQTIDVVVAFAGEMQRRHGYWPRELSLGGGWAVAYTPEDAAPAIEDVARTLARSLLASCQRHGMPAPRLSIEPGRAIVARAGVALYTVGAVKEVPGLRRYACIDGGMGDNIRPALYGATYTAVVANRMRAATSERVSIAGRYCESGDILIEDITLPALEPGDVLAVPVCGAYAPAMASNYNMTARPAIVGVTEGKARLWRRREKLADLIGCERGGNVEPGVHSRQT